MVKCRHGGYPNVNAYASAPGSKKVIFSVLPGKCIEGREAAAFSLNPSLPERRQGPQSIDRGQEALPPGPARR